MEWKKNVISIDWKLELYSGNNCIDITAVRFA